MNPTSLCKKFLTFLDTDTNIIIHKLPRKYAGKLVQPRFILIDDKKDDVLSVLVHELLHVTYPKKSEASILRLERQFMRCASWRQKKILLGRLIK